MGELPDALLLLRIRRILALIRDRVIESLDSQEAGSLSRVAAETAGDTIYQVDRVSEESLTNLFEEHLAGETSFVLVGEGLPEGGTVYPDGLPHEEATYRIIVDPIDGTRGLMYDKRSAWVLAGVARNRGEATSLGDIFLAVQTEIPTTKQFRCDVAWAIRGTGAGAEGYDRLAGTSMPVRLRPSRATTVEHGFAMLSRFFPGAKEVLAAAEEELVEALIGPVEEGKARLFEDQYISSGGQFYELMAGHDRFNADLRPGLERVLRARGRALGICCHPYDVCTELVAREFGVVVTDPLGGPLNAPLDTTSPVAWVAYANESLRRAVEPVLQRVLKNHDLI